MPAMPAMPDAADRSAPLTTPFAPPAPSSGSTALRHRRQKGRQSSAGAQAKGGSRRRGAQRRERNAKGGGGWLGPARPADLAARRRPQPTLDPRAPPVPSVLGERKERRCVSHGASGNARHNGSISLSLDSRGSS